MQTWATKHQDKDIWEKSSVLCALCSKKHLVSTSCLSAAPSRPSEFQPASSHSLTLHWSRTSALKLPSNCSWMAWIVRRSLCRLSLTLREQSAWKIWDLIGFQSGEIVSHLPYFKAYDQHFYTDGTINRGIQNPACVTRLVALFGWNKKPSCQPGGSTFHGTARSMVRTYGLYLTLWLDYRNPCSLRVDRQFTVKLSQMYEHAACTKATYCINCGRFTPPGWQNYI